MTLSQAVIVVTLQTITTSQITTNTKTLSRLSNASMCSMKVVSIRDLTLARESEVCVVCGLELNSELSEPMCLLLSSLNI